MRHQYILIISSLLFLLLNTTIKSSAQPTGIDSLLAAKNDCNGQECLDIIFALLSDDNLPDSIRTDLFSEVFSSEESIPKEYLAKGYYLRAVYRNTTYQTHLAIEDLNTVLNYLRPDDKNIYFGLSYVGLVKAYSFIQEFDSSGLYLDSAFAVFSKYQDKEGLGLYHGAKAADFTFRNEFVQANHHLRKAVLFFKEVQNIESIHSSQIHIAKNYYFLGLYNESIIAFLELLEGAKQLSHHNTNEAYLFLAYNYYELKQYDDASICLKRVEKAYLGTGLDPY